MSVATPSGPPKPVATPCVQVCMIDSQSGLCLGCQRTLPEIGGWSRFSADKRDEIMAELKARRSQIDPVKLAKIWGP